MTGTRDRVLMIGDRAPDFQLPDVNMKIRKLSDYLGKKTVLAFFPAAESPTCTAEMCNFRDSITDLQKSGAQIVGISVDGPFANKIFTENRHLNFDLLSDYKRETFSYSITRALLRTSGFQMTLLLNLITRRLMRRSQRRNRVTLYE
jgi:peroxiredoxin